MARIALLHSPITTTRQEQTAAMQGLERFRGFGVQIEMLEVGRDKTGHVKCNHTLRKAVTNKNTTFLWHDDLKTLSISNLWCILKGDELTVGIGITNSDIVLSYHPENLRMGDGKVIGCAGASSALVNVRPFRALEDTVKDSAIRLAVVHEIGHVFGVVPHCKEPNCVMQENTGKTDFIERFVIPGLDFCRQCTERIAQDVRSMAQKF